MQRKLIIILLVLIGAMVCLQRAMQPKSARQHEAEKPPDKVAQVRARDLAKLMDPAAKNWQIAPNLKVVTTDSGLKYQDVKLGMGRSPKKGDTVVVDYAGWKVDGRKFDCSLDPGRAPIMFRMGDGRVIKGWEEGISTMKMGGIRRLVIPPDLAYGELGRPPMIEPNSTLVFMVRLVQIEPAK